MADILIVDDQDRYMQLCRRAIPEHHYRGPARCWRQASEMLARSRGRIDLVLLDVHFDIPDDELVGAGPPEDLRNRQGFEILKLLRARHPDLPVILMTSREEVPLAEAADALEAQEYTWFLDDEYVDARSLSAQIAGIAAARHAQEAEGPIYWGRSLKMRAIRQKLGVLAGGRLPVLLLGPTGTGKSLIARHYLHERSGRTGKFVAVDLSTIPTNLMAAHLFGAAKGSYTGAVSDRLGAFEAANHGTLFLDEIGNLSMEAQKMLLSVLQEGIVTRIGELHERPVDTKLVVATNEDLAARVADGTFRADLYMRLNPAAAVRLPSLAERQLDQARLLEFAVQRALERPYLRGLVDDYRQRNALSAGTVEVVVGGPAPDARPGVLHLLFAERAVRALKAHPWPGNLREFAMTVENAALFALTEMLAVPGGDRPDVVPVRPKVVRDLLASAPAGASRGQGDVLDADDDGVPGWRIRVSVRPNGSLNKVAQDTERQYFKALYLEHEGDFTKMAQILLGDQEHARKVQLRFNQLGLKVRELKEQL